MKTGVNCSKNLAASRYQYDESPLKSARPADTIILIAKTPKRVTLRTILAIDTKTGVIRSKNLAVSRYRYDKSTLKSARPADPIILIAKTPKCVKCILQVKLKAYFGESYLHGFHMICCEN